MENNETTETTPQPIPSTEFNLYGETSTSSLAVPEKTTETTSIVEAPVTTATEPKVDPTTTTDPVIQEKVVEKIVEKLPEFKDEYSKQLFEALLEGKDSEVYEYLKTKNTDFNTMSDVDVVKKQMKLQNPTWGDKYIDVEFKNKYGNLAQPKDLSQIDPELDAEDYQKALEYNDALEMKEVLLSQAAIDARIALENTKKTVEFPKITQTEAPVSTQPKTQEEVDELNRKWEEKVTSDMANLSDFKFKVGDEEIVYKITDEDKASQTAYMKEYSGMKMAQDLGWVDADGNENVLKIAEDMLKLKNFDKVVASTATQMKTTATKEVVAEIKNLDLLPTPSTTETEQVSLGKLLYG